MTILCDLDGTLAHYTVWQGIEHIGEPIPKMIDRVRNWVQQGREVKIFTARVSVADPDDRQTIVEIIQDWLERQGLPRLEVTCTKDFGMIELWDDRAVQIIMNTGERADGQLD